MSAASPAAHTVASGLSAGTAALLARLVARRPRVQCLTNTVAQQLTANALLALGADASMAVHPDEIGPMAASADALLVNLGTPDPTRIAAIEALIAAPGMPGGPVVLDPVFVHRSPLRRDLAARLLAAWPGAILKGNAAEMAALTRQGRPEATRIVTGPIDRIESAGRVVEISGGHPLMARVTGAGCALGAVVAAFAAVAETPLAGAVAALETYAAAAERAGGKAAGPGSFAMHFLDALAALAAETGKGP